MMARIRRGLLDPARAGRLVGWMCAWPARRMALGAVAGGWLALLFVPVLAHPPTTLIPAAQTIAIGDDASVAAHDVEAGVDAVFRVSGPIQPIGRCPEQGASGQHDHPNRGYYDSIWITGCEPGGTGEVRLVERANESNVIARATIVVVRHTYPSHIRNLTQSGQGDGTLTVTWDAPRRTGGSAIVGYGVQHRLDGDEWASEVPAVRDTTGTGTSHTVTGLTNGTKYHLRVTPCNQESGCLPWSAKAGFSHASVSGTPAVPRPQNLNLTPLGDRKARLNWTWPDSNPDKEPNAYRVTARVVGLAGEPSDSDQWHQVLMHDHDPDKDTDRHRAIELDDFVRPIGRGPLGLAHHQAYELRVEAVFGTVPSEGNPDTRTYSRPSDHIIIIDTPITRVTAANATSTSDVVREYSDVGTTLNDRDYAKGTGTYEFRYQEVGHSQYAHTDAKWKPNAFAPLTSGALTSEKIYGVQVVIQPRDGTKPRAYAGRDAYFWPSSRAAAGGERVASFPVDDFFTDGDTQYPLIYKYRICERTFPTDAQDDWRSVINHAFGQWQTAMGSQIQLSEDSGRPCADSTPFVRESARRAMEIFRKNSHLTVDEITGLVIADIESQVKSLFNSMLEMGYNYRDTLILESVASEIRLVDNVGEVSSVGYLTNRVAAFPQMGRHFGLRSCGFRVHGCAVPQGFVSREGFVHDILINHEPFQDAGPTTPSDVRCNTCVHGSGLSNDQVKLEKKLYNVLVHEAGHVVGINKITSEVEAQEHHHPNGDIGDSVYDVKSPFIGSSHNPLCSPTPLDVLAINAVLQTRYGD